MATEPEKVLKRSVYFLAALPFVAGLVICTLLTVKAVKKVMGSAENFTRVVVPGATTIEFAKPGNYTIFFEHKSVIDGVAYSSSEDAISGIRCTIRNVDTGIEVPVIASSANMNYSLGSREGRAYFEFKIPVAGKYRLEAAFPAGQGTGQRFVFAITQGFMREIFEDVGLILTIVGIFIFSAVGSAAAFIIIYMRRERAAKPSGV